MESERIEELTGADLASSISWQRIAAQYDRKAHRKNGLILLTFTGSFRAMNARIPAERIVQYSVMGSHLETLIMAETTLHALRPKAKALDERIAIRRQQRPHERRYLYDVEE